jgi:hypothetical protein
VTDLKYIKDLLFILKANGIASFKTAGLELVFHMEQPTTGDFKLPVQDLPVTSHTIDAPEPPNMPADLRSDTLMSEDHILNWSAPPDSTTNEQIPLTGDQPL